MKQALSSTTSLPSSLPLGNHQPRIPLFSVALWASYLVFSVIATVDDNPKRRKFTPLSSVFANTAQTAVAELAETEEPSSERAVAGDFSPTLLPLTATSVRRSRYRDEKAASHSRSRRAEPSSRLQVTTHMVELLRFESRFNNFSARGERSKPRS